MTMQLSFMFCRLSWSSYRGTLSAAAIGFSCFWRGETPPVPKHGKDIDERRNSHNVVRFENLFLEK